MNDDVIWKARKRNLLLFGLPISFTVYSLDDDAFFVTTGLLNMNFEEIKLYKIRDYSITRSLIQRIFGLGTIRILSADSSCPELFVRNIKDVMSVKKLIEMKVDEARKKTGIKTQEFYVADRPGQH